MRTECSSIAKRGVSLIGSAEYKEAYARYQQWKAYTESLARGEDPAPPTSCLVAKRQMEDDDAVIVDEAPPKRPRLKLPPPSSSATRPSSSSKPTFRPQVKTEHKPTRRKATATTVTADDGTVQRTPCQRCAKKHLACFVRHGAEACVQCRDAKVRCSLRSFEGSTQPPNLDIGRTQRAPRAPREVAERGSGSASGEYRLGGLGFSADFRDDFRAQSPADRVRMLEDWAIEFERNRTLVLRRIEALRAERLARARRLVEEQMEWERTEVNAVADENLDWVRSALEEAREIAERNQEQWEQDMANGDFDLDSEDE